MTNPVASRVTSVGGRIVPALAVTAILFLIALRGPLDLWSIGIGGTFAAAAGILILVRAPLVLYWLVPVSMVWYVETPILPYDILLLLLGGMLVVEAWPTFEPRRIRLNALEWRYLFFLASLAITLAIPDTSLRRLLYAFKLYATGLIAFEVARLSTARFGRLRILWGVGAFAAATAATLWVRLIQSGVPVFRGVELRTYLSDLSWGTTNYVAAVQVLCLPSLVYMIRSVRQGLRWIPIAVIVVTMASMFLTGSRGGFILGLGYLVVQGVRVKRRAWIGIGIMAVTALTLIVTPFGQSLVLRFTSLREIGSVFHRFNIWHAAWQRGVDAFPLGLGAGQGFVQHDRLGNIDPHSFYLTLFSEGGPIAIVLWLWIIAALWNSAQKLSHEERTVARGSALKATIILALFNASFEVTFPAYLYAVLFWWLAGIMHGRAPDMSRAGAGEPARTSPGTV